MHFISFTESPYPRASPRPPDPARVGPYRTSKLRGLPAGPPETRAPPGFVRHGCEGGGELSESGDNGYPDWGRRQWPPGPQQPLHSAAQTAEMEIGGGGGGGGWEQRRRGRGAGDAEEGRSWSVKAGRGEMGEELLGREAGAGGGGGRREREMGAWGREPRAQEHFRRLSDRCCGAWGGGGVSTFPCPLSAPPATQMSLPRLALPASSRGHSRKHSLAQ